MIGYQEHKELPPRGGVACGAAAHSAALPTIRSEPMLERSQDYSIALQRAIESHCRGVVVPDWIANQCPHHAKMLNDRLGKAERERDEARAALKEAMAAMVGTCVSELDPKFPASWRKAAGGDGNG